MEFSKIVPDELYIFEGIPMSIFSSFTKRNNLIKTLQFKLTPMYGTVEQMEKLGVLNKGRERSSCWNTVLDVLRRVDAALIAKALTDGAALDWQPLARALAAGERGEFVRQQAEMRKAVTKRLIKHSDYKSIVNPNKTIKMAANREYPKVCVNLQTDVR